MCVLFTNAVVLDGAMVLVGDTCVLAVMGEVVTLLVVTGSEGEVGGGGGTGGGLGLVEDWVVGWSVAGITGEGHIGKPCEQMGLYAGFWHNVISTQIPYAGCCFGGAAEMKQFIMLYGIDYHSLLIRVV